MTVYKGNAHVYGDYVYPARFGDNIDMAQAAHYVLAEIDPEFEKRIQPGDILVAGENFGGGKSASRGAEALKAAGIALVAAKSYWDGFLLQAEEVGLPVFIIGDHRTEMGDPVTVDTERGVLINEVTHHEAALTSPET